MEDQNSSNIVSVDGELTLHVGGTGVHIHFDTRGSARSPAEIASRVQACLERIGMHELAFALAPLRDVKRQGESYIASVDPIVQCATSLAKAADAMPSTIRNSQDFTVNLLALGDAINRNSRAGQAFVAALEEFNAGCARASRQALN